MPDPDTHEEVAWTRAKSRAARTYRSPLFGVAATIAQLIALPITILVTADPNTSTTTEASVTVLVGALVLALTFLSVLVVQLVVAPYAQRNEERERARSLRLQLAEATSAGPPGETEEQRKARQRLQVAVAKITEELEHGRSALEQPRIEFFGDYQLAEEKWKEFGHELAAAPEAHRVARNAYRLIDEVNRSVSRDWGGDPVRAIRVHINENKAGEAADAIDTALTALEPLMRADR